MLSDERYLRKQNRKIHEKIRRFQNSENNIKANKETSTSGQQIDNEHHVKFISITYFMVEIRSNTDVSASNVKRSYSTLLCSPLFALIIGNNIPSKPVTVWELSDEHFIVNGCSCLRSHLSRFRADLYYSR